MDTGHVELHASNLTILNSSKVPPFYINEDQKIDETLRLEYRYLDLRRERLQKNIRLRYEVVKFMRDFFDKNGFVEIETPILIKSTPEGARDFLVPSRLQRGSFYALPQSPQQLKQLLMVAGFEKYFQIARCFRDEDLRADRQPEFTQLDIEMSFVDEEDILDLIENLYVSLIRALTPNKKVTTPLVRLSYEESIEKYGSDKPDLRFGLELATITDIALESKAQILHNIANSGGLVKGFSAPGCSEYSRKQIDELIEIAKDCGAAGLVTIGIEDGGSIDGLEMGQVRSGLAKYLEIEEVKAICSRMGAGRGDLILIVAGDSLIVNRALSVLRQEMAKRLDLMDSDVLSLAWVVNFPLLEWQPDENRWDSPHNPFSSPKDEHVGLLLSEPGSVTAKQYDLICNGFEMGGGSIRNHKVDMQKKIFELMGHSEEQMYSEFGQLLNALEYGAPPHGGIACGVERLVMLLADEENIRETMVFPKTQSGSDLLFGSPSPVDESQLKELGLEIISE
jgi:aspartyl-tRNA synthetase